MLEAAVQENHGVPLTGRQGGSLFFNLRYRGLFLKASKRGQSLKMGPPNLPPDQENINAMVAALLASP
ncbi:hypothetical protein LMG28614_00569 [Paraburkholderia ultramafica]|uniref:Uncharacterized protein n=1 Tax=Paraburkholderia ultramafica TaxID=1544867 RepID=A0A6S7CDS5_9BURK|nr:hypothetical protein [Paraburkholderia ultramafica]CAB3778216.1 hypothetical protein LMG28614_00569 [Paraburkholderia ultramafica]